LRTRRYERIYSEPFKPCFAGTHRGLRVASQMLGIGPRAISEGE